VNEISDILMPPVHLIERVTGSIDNDWFNKSGSITVNEWGRALASIGKNFNDFDTIVDYGCGCGRALRHLSLILKSNQKVYGLDPDSEAIEWINGAYNKLQIQGIALNNYPPIPLEDGTADLIVSHSVFTHLPEDTQFAWLNDLSRILKKDAILIASFHGSKVAKGYIRSLIDLGRVDDAIEFMDKMLRKGFYYVQGRTVAEMKLPEYYGSAFHSIEYILGNWLDNFDMLAWYPVFALNHQDVLVLKKR